MGAAVDRVLYDTSISKEGSLKRAKAILTIGGIFKTVEADESDLERRELERSVPLLVYGYIEADLPDWS